VLECLESQKWKDFSKIVVMTCAYAGSGNVIKI